MTAIFTRKTWRALRTWVLVLWPLGLLILSTKYWQAAQSSPATAHFAVIGDFGSDGENELDVSNLIRSWNPDFITTVGDNNYPNGDASTIDANIGKYFHDFIFP